MIIIIIIKLKFDHTNKWYKYNSESILENDTQKLLWDFDVQMDHQTIRLYNNQQKRDHLQDWGLCSPGRPQSKIEKKWAKKHKYLDLPRELKKLWKVTIIPIVIGALGTVTKVLVQGLEDVEITRRVETVQTTALLRSARILRRVMET